MLCTYLRCMGRQVCDEQLLQGPEQALLEKENSGCEVLLLDNKTDDLSRMYRLFSRIPTGLPPIGNIVRKHITDVGLALVKKQSTAADTDLMPYVQADTEPSCSRRS